MQHQSDRRRFIKFAGASAATLALGGLWTSRAMAADKISVDDPTAKALHYTDDASHVDQAANPNYAAGHHCGNCALYQASAEKDGHAPCAAFGGKLVAKSGWCAAWASKPA
ncbi:high-potential iron-sulfur protein [Solimonas marina]|uniref:Twin-arginine translocation signal domain-containing protein n=1 Tax=Solimonas marina TaxID=2714601 RepID=A0A969WEM6_9GAMM|nr:high-potential iron-sulfur protein [Solimonas marina]NKF24633.1 twin-arginine translocation signal domain-containing protein [Solimonas marina]